MSGIGDRHTGTAGEALNVGGKPVSVEIRLGPDVHAASVQHTAWMLLNILCRLEGVVSVVRINCPLNVKAAPKLSPLIVQDLPFRESLFAGAHAIGSPAHGFAGVEPATQPSDIIVSVGFGFTSEANFCVAGSGLCGGIFTREIAAPPASSSLPIGPYIAACLAAGEIFRLVRLKSYVPERQLFVNALDYSHSDDPAWVDLNLTGDLGSTLLVGVGAVGCALLHALYSLPLQGTLRIADNDLKGIEDTNLGRYTLFGWASIGKFKASHSADLLGNATFKLLPHDGGFEHFFSSLDKPQIVLSAVDKNGSRHALQEQYPPLILSASTHNLRTELLRCGPPSVGACLACFNPLETQQRTEDEIRALLASRPEVVAGLCEKLRLDRDEVAAWIQSRRCSETGDRLVEELRTDDGVTAAFAVGFVSVLAGVFLASEVLKNIGGFRGPLNDNCNRALFQFQNPSAVTNKAQFYSRDDQCSACSSKSAGTQIWTRRYAEFGKVGISRR